MDTNHKLLTSVTCYGTPFNFQVLLDMEMWIL